MNLLPSAIAFLGIIIIAMTIPTGVEILANIELPSFGFFFWLLVGEVISVIFILWVLSKIVGRRPPPK